MTNKSEVVEAMNTIMKLAMDEIFTGEESTICNTSHIIPNCAIVMNKYISNMESICAYYGVDVTDFNYITNAKFVAAHNFAISKVSSRLRSRVEMFKRLESIAYCFCKCFN